MSLLNLLKMITNVDLTPKDIGTPPLIKRYPIPRTLESKVVSKNCKLQRGIVLKIETSNLKSLGLKFNHFGIYAGNNEVFHLKQSGLEKVGIFEFTGGQDTCEVMGFKKELKYTLEESYFRADLELATNFAEYDVKNNNCEHFALWCRTGEAISTQTGGTKSGEYYLTSSSCFISLPISRINIPDIISRIYSFKFGMKESRTIDINKIEDIEFEKVDKKNQ